MLRPATLSPVIEGVNEWIAQKLVDRTCERPPSASRLSPVVRGTIKPLSPLQRGTAAKRQGVAHTFGLIVFAVIDSFTPSMTAAPVLRASPSKVVFAIMRPFQSLKK